jgi:hypothetical protein
VNQDLQWEVRVGFKQEGMTESPGMKTCLAILKKGQITSDRSKQPQQIGSFNDI